MNEIHPDILSWDWFSEPHGYDFHGTLVRHASGNLCVDPVEPSADDLDQLAAEGVARILITNRNHGRAANTVKERTGARIAIHPADAPHAKKEGLSVDDELQVGQRIGPFEIVAAPGKSPGEVALHDKARRLLLVGDVLIGNPPGKLSLLPERVMDDPAKLRESVTRLLELDLETIVVGDGVPVLTGAQEQLRALVASFSDS